MSVQDRFEADIALTPEAYVIQELRHQLDVSPSTAVPDSAFQRGYSAGIRQAMAMLDDLRESQGVTP